VIDAFASVDEGLEKVGGCMHRFVIGSRGQGIPRPVLL
jgi:hypothetical protein